MEWSPFLGVGFIGGASPNQKDVQEHDVTVRKSLQKTHIYIYIRNDVRHVFHVAMVIPCNGDRESAFRGIMDLKDSF